MRAAIKAARRAGAARCVVAVPVGAADTCDEMRRHADELHCLASPEPFFGVGSFYEDFSQVEDEEVRRLLEDSAA
jgi:predicted phosphoribosyltransferase